MVLAAHGGRQAPLPPHRIHAHQPPHLPSGGGHEEDQLLSRQLSDVIAVHRHHAGPEQQQLRLPPQPLRHILRVGASACTVQLRASANSHGSGQAQEHVWFLGA